MSTGGVDNGGIGIIDWAAWCPAMYAFFISVFKKGGGPLFLFLFLFLLGWLGTGKGACFCLRGIPAPPSTPHALVSTMVKHSRER